MTAPFESTIRTLEQRLGEVLPGRAAQVTMAPLRPDAFDRIDVADKNCREAGVLVLLLPEHGETHVLVTVRKSQLASHAGQISFPGGRREADESLLQTALREAREEVDLNPADVEVIGELSPLYIPPSNYCVQPFVGFVRATPRLSPHDHEVERIVTLPLSSLLDEASIRKEMRDVRGTRIRVPLFEVAGLQIWGATAMMLAELLALLRDA